MRLEFASPWVLLPAGLRCVFSSVPAVSSSIFVGDEREENLLRKRDHAWGCAREITPPEKICRLQSTDINQKATNTHLKNISTGIFHKKLTIRWPKHPDPFLKIGNMSLTLLSKSTKPGIDGKNNFLRR